MLVTGQVNGLLSILSHLRGESYGVSYIGFYLCTSIQFELDCNYSISSVTALATSRVASISDGADCNIDFILSRSFGS